MLEILAILITIGEVSYHFDNSFAFALAISILIASIVFIYIKGVRGLVISLLILFTILLGTVNVWRTNNPIPTDFFGSRAISARVLEVDRRLDRTFLIVKDESYREKIRISLAESQSYLPGDSISIKGRVEIPEDFITDSGRIFEYKSYLDNKGIIGVMNNPENKLLKEGGFSINRLATKVRYGLAEIFSKNITFPFDGVVSAMLFGYQGGIPDSISDLFRNTGVLHMLVLSGYNITLFVAFITIILNPVPFRTRMIIVIAMITMLVLVSGGGVAALRAGIMGSIGAFSGLAKRTYNALRALTISYIFFIFVSPNVIFIDPGFHLSFLATFFIIFILPKTENFFKFIPNYKYLNLREIITLAIMMPIFTLPYIMYFSGIFPFVSPIANAVLSLFTPIIMILGIIIIITSLIPPIAFVFGTILSLTGNFVISFLQKMGEVPVWNTPPIPWWSVVIFYLVLITILFRKEITLYLMQIGSSLRQKPSSSVK